MALMVRNQFETDNRRRQLLLLLALVAGLAMTDELEGAANLYVDFVKRMKLRKAPIGRIFAVAALMTNMHTCVYKNRIGMYFYMAHRDQALLPPSLEDYLHGGIL